MTVIRVNVPAGAIVRRDVAFPAGTADAVVGAQFQREECGCLVEFCIRTDNAEKARLDYPCPAHADGWHVVVDGLQNDTEIDDTTVLLDQLIGDLP